MVNTQLAEGFESAKKYIDFDGGLYETVKNLEISNKLDLLILKQLTGLFENDTVTTLQTDFPDEA